MGAFRWLSAGIPRGMLNLLKILTGSVAMLNFRLLGLSRLRCRKMFKLQKAAEDCRSPKAGALIAAPILRGAFWTAAVLCRFSVPKTRALAGVLWE